jgi:hypothetical protein
LEKNLSQCHFVHHKLYTDWCGREIGSAQWQAGNKLPAPQHGLYLMTVCWMYPPLPCTSVVWSLGKTKLFREADCIWKWVRTVSTSGLRYW